MARAGRVPARLVIGVLGTTLLAELCVLVMQATGSAGRSMGASADEWTASELRRLRRNGSRLVNHSGSDAAISTTSWSAGRQLSSPRPSGRPLLQGLTAMRALRKNMQTSAPIAVRVTTRNSIVRVDCRADVRDSLQKCAALARQWCEQTAHPRNV